MTFLGLSQTFGSLAFLGFFGFAIVIFTYDRTFSMIFSRRCFRSSGATATQ